MCFMRLVNWCCTTLLYINILKNLAEGLPILKPVETVATTGINLNSYNFGCNNYHYYNCHNIVYNCHYNYHTIVLSVLEQQSWKSINCIGMRLQFIIFCLFVCLFVCLPFWHMLLACLFLFFLGLLHCIEVTFISTLISLGEGGSFLPAANLNLSYF